jgi:serine/threonine-protein kinase
VHRDISPQNVLLSWDGAVRISDFGIAKARAATQASASVIIKGKAAYMSPEQVQGAPLDGRSDLFAVGVMLWEMLCGAPLFHHDDRIEATLAAVLFGDVPSPRSRRPDLPADIEQVTMQLLEKQRERRFQSAAAALAALATCAAYPRSGREALALLMAARLPDRAPRRGPLPPAAPEGRADADDSPPSPRVTVADPPRRRLPAFEDPYGPAVARRADRRRRRTRRLALLAGGVVAGATLGAMLHFLNGRDADADRSAPSTPQLAQPSPPAPSPPAPSPPAPSPPAPSPPAPSPPGPRSAGDDARPAGSSPAARGASPGDGSAPGSEAMARGAQPRPHRAPTGPSGAGPRERTPQAAALPAESGFREIDLRATSSD